MKLKQLIHKSAKTPSQKLLNQNTFTREQVVAMLHAFGQPTEPVVSGIAAVKKPVKPVAKPSKPKAGAVVEFSDDGKWALLRITGTDGRDNAYGIRRLVAILENLDAVKAFVEEYAELQNIPTAE